MRRKRRTEIRIEKREVVILRRRDNVTILCNECGARVRAVGPDVAAAAMGTSLRAIFRQVEAGRLHACEMGDGMLFICLNSLPPSIGEGDHGKKDHEA